MAKAYRIRIEKNWFYDRFNFLTPGVYLVPNHVKPNMATRAINEGAAVLLDDGSAKKKPSPEKKVMEAAPENKAGQTGKAKPSSLPVPARRKEKKT